MSVNLQLQLTDIQSKIQIYRNQRVMLDADLAELYGIENKRLKESVRRNIERFEGEDFMFQLSTEEIVELSRTQFATLNKTRSNIIHRSNELRNEIIQSKELIQNGQFK